MQKWALVFLVYSSKQLEKFEYRSNVFLIDNYAIDASDFKVKCLNWPESTKFSYNLLQPSENCYLFVNYQTFDRDGKVLH